jgi:hypothetical protein
MEEKNKPYPAKQHDESNFIAMEAHPNPEEVGAEVDHFSDNIPTEIAFLIFSFLDLKSLCLVSLVSKYWNQLANDELLWKERLEQYSQGYLWRYLFKNPDKSAYQKYFSEIYLKPNLTSDNFFETTKMTKENLQQFIIATRASERKENLEKYFQQIDADKTGKLLNELIEETQKLSSEVRSNFLNKNLTDLTKNSNFSKLIIILRKIDSIEVLLTNQFYLYNFFCLYPKKINDLVHSSITAFLKPSTIVTIMACVGDFILPLAPFLVFTLLNKLNRDELIDCARSFGYLAEFILHQSYLINRLTDEALITIFSQTEEYRLENTLFEILSDNPQLLSRCNTNFLMQLIDSVENFGFQYLPNLILGHPVLINRLTEEQCIEILLKRKGSIFGQENIRTLQSEAFKAYTLGLKNPRNFLLRLPNFDEMYSFDWVAELLTAEDALKAKDDLATAEAIANQDIFVKKFNKSQLLELADRHTNLALILLKKEYLIYNWTHEDLSFIKREARGLELIAKINATIDEIKIKHRQDLINQRPLALKEGKNKPYEHYQLPQSSYARATLQLKIQPEFEKRESTKDVLPLKKIDSMNRHHMSILRKNSRQSSDSVAWSIMGLVGLALLLTLGILLCATGVGAVAGVPFLVSTIALLPLSLEAVVIPCLIIGVFMSLAGCNLMLEHSTKLLKPIIPSIKDFFIKSSSEHKLPYYSMPRKRPNVIFEPLPRLSLTLESSKVTQSISNEENHSPRFNQ